MKTSISQTPSPQQRRIALWLSVCLGLFVFRVISQVVVLVLPLAYFPAFDAWHSAVLPYPALFTSQLILIGLLGWVVARYWRAPVAANPGRGRWLSRIGWLYWSAMGLRVVLGLSLLAHVHFFAQTLPGLFHLILASMLLLAGDYHQRGAR